MAPGSEAVETILIVDDEAPVRQTFHDWLEGARLGCTVLAAGDDVTALQLANTHSIDLAILDWNLGAGTDGLRLLEDLREFSPDVTAIMITGYAHQATPLAAMRMGVRDYLDKNQGLNRDSFLAVVRKQLEHIRPAKRERRVRAVLEAFQSAVRQVLPLVQTAAALQGPVPLPSSFARLFQFLLRTTGAREGALVAHSYDQHRQPPEVYRAYDSEGRLLDVPLVPFARSVAGSVVGMQEPAAMEQLDRAASAGSLELQPFEAGKRSLLAAPLSVAPGLQVVLELFDKPTPFNEADRALARAAADFGGELVRQALAERQTYQVLFDALEAALRGSDALAGSLAPVPAPAPEGPPPRDVLDQLRQGLGGGEAEVDAGATLRLAEAIRLLAARYGPASVEHCARLVEGLRGLLDEVTGSGGPVS